LDSLLNVDGFQGLLSFSSVYEDTWC
jgi:hypothetical protein